MDKSDDGRRTDGTFCVSGPTRKHNRVIVFMYGIGTIYYLKKFRFIFYRFVFRSINEF